MKNFLLPLLLAAVPCLAQNTCETAVTVTTGTYTTGTIDGTNVTNGCWNSIDIVGDHAVWYKYTPETDGIARLTTAFEENDGDTMSDNTKFSVYGGTCANMYCHAMDGLWSEAESYLADTTFEVRTGKTYYIAFDDYWSNKKLKFELSLETPMCNTEFPFIETWNSPLGFTCWKTFNTNHIQKWGFYMEHLADDIAYTNVAASFPAQGPGPKNDWLISPALHLEAGKDYTFSIKYNALQVGTNIVEEMFAAKLLSEPTPIAPVQAGLGQVSNIAQTGGTSAPFNYDGATTVSYTYTAEATGDMYLGIHALTPSNAENNILIIYEVRVDQVLANETPDASAFMVFPNPANDRITVSGADITSIEVTDMNGRIINRTAYNNATAAEMDLSGMQSGMYLVKIASLQGQETKKVIKK